MFDNCTTTRGKDGPYQVDDLLAGKYGGEPGAALMLFRTYPRVAFWEQVHDSIPFYTDCGRLAATAICPKRSSSAKTWWCIAKRSRPRRICPT